VPEEEDGAAAAQDNDEDVPPLEGDDDEEEEEEDGQPEVEEVPEAEEVKNLIFYFPISNWLKLFKTFIFRRNLLLKRDLLGFAERARSRKEESSPSWSKKFNFPRVFLFFRVGVSGWMKERVPFMGERKTKNREKPFFFVCVI